ncbi:MAG: DEAD/DEAH box helicase [Myxococcales bacterium]|nr:DEAD/DEAH box helicase [Myxococcales bacterium]
MLAGLRDAIREAASTRAWSQGVTLAREERVSGRSATPSEHVLDVRVPTRPTPYTVVLYPQDDEWDCDCGARDAACSHACAAAIVCADAEARGEPVPRSKVAGAAIGYRLTADPAGLAVARVAVDNGREQPITESVVSLAAGRGSGLKLATTAVDLIVDQLLGSRPSAPIGADRVDKLLTALADATDVRFAGDPIRTSGELVVPRAILSDAGDGVVVRLEAPTGAKAVSLGVARIGDTLHPIGAIDLGGARLEHLPAEQRFRARELGAVASTMVPALAARIPIEFRTRRLPSVARGIAPRAMLDVIQRGEMLSVMAIIVYGDPPVARVDGDRLVHLGGDVPVRDLDGEQLLRHRMRSELDLLPGRRIEASGRDAFELQAKLARWLRADAAAADTARAVPLAISVDVTRGLVVGVTGEGRAVDPLSALRAWQAGADLVALDGGGWGALPMQWLARHGAILGDLLAARDPEGALPAFALPDAARLAADLGVDAPLDLTRLRALADDFDGIPPAVLPPGLVAELRHYQRRGIDWLAFCRDAGLGCVLADDMGLGKTIQALAAINGRTLVVCPTSVAPNWQSETARFRPDLKVALYHGSRRRLDEAADLTITTYPIVRNDIDELAAVGWDTVILDEAQAIKNPDSQIARAAYRLRGAWRVSLSGTPIENRLDELWSQLHFTNPGLLGARVDFRDRWATAIEAGDAETATRLRARVRPFVMRRLKREVAPELPPRTEAVLWVELDDDERTTYDAIRAATQQDVIDLLEAGGGVMAALEALLRLRQAACHRGLLPGQRADGSTKLTTLIEAVSAAVAAGGKALVFSQWTSLLDRVEPAMTAEGLAFTRLDGSTRDRAGVVATFQDPAGPPVMLLSLKAGGTGLNLTEADHVFLLDPWWNPAVEDQAADRAHRIGQDKPVMIYRLVARDTVEERVLALQDKKRAIAAAALDGGAALAITRDDLLDLLR